MTDRPRIDAPGLTWRMLKHGWECRWRARADLVKRGFIPKIARLWVATPDNSQPSPAAMKWIADRANALQTEMLVWGRGGIEHVGVYDGTWASLIECYQSDPDSPYLKKRFASRQHDETLCRRIKKDMGETLIADTDARKMLRMHEQWSADGKVAMGHALVSMTRMLTKFGGTLLKKKDCREFNVTMHDMRFAMAKPRSERLTASQADAIRSMAPSIGRRSLALAQAFQFDLALRQKDVIGEWVPVSEPGMSDVIDRNEKWLRGIRWEEIDDNLIIRHVTSKRLKEIEVDLSSAPMVMEELRFLAKLAPGEKLTRDLLPTSGPIVISEHNDLPWTAYEYRRRWRMLANACGIPKTIRNMDSRAGAISEATDAGAQLEDVRHMATHSDISMTQRYSRNATEKGAKVMKLRVEHRKNNAG